MKIKKIPINKILKDSFNFVFSDFLEKFKKGFFIVFLITLGFNGLNFLISSSLATNFTIFLFITFSILLMSSIGISVHKEIIENQKQDFFLDFLSIKNFKYFLTILLITLTAISPFVIHYLFKIFNIIKILNFNISLLFVFWMITSALALRLIFILPKIALDIKINKISKELNNSGFQLLVLFFIVTVIFFIPSAIIVSFQVSLLATNSQIFSILKPFFDLVSFYISYFNYLIIFAVISYSYKISESK